jgi:hypothetical protein
MGVRGVRVFRRLFLKEGVRVREGVSNDLRIT